MSEVTNPVMMEQVQQALEAAVNARTFLDSTVLAGWPHKEPPTTLQTKRIVVVFAELELHDLLASELARWRVAGQIVARLERDGVA